MIENHWNSLETVMYSLGFASLGLISQSYLSHFGTPGRGNGPARCFRRFSLRPFTCSRAQRGLRNIMRPSFGDLKKPLKKPQKTHLKRKSVGKTASHRLRMRRFSPSRWAERRRAQIARAELLRRERRVEARPPPPVPQVTVAKEKLRPPWATEEESYLETFLDL